MDVSRNSDKRFGGMVYTANIRENANQHEFLFDIKGELLRHHIIRKEGDAFEDPMVINDF
ncbi:hypothetical protein DMZ48_17680 [Robertkochia solimangrovi]|nr:hypothetical protein DMZ48_17680 [Robertkochia solimangrovi]